MTTKPKTVKGTLIDVKTKVIHGQTVVVKIFAPVIPKIKYVVR